MRHPQALRDLLGITKRRKVCDEEIEEEEKLKDVDTMKTRK